MSQQLSDDEVRDALAALPGWTGDAGGLVREVEVDEADRELLASQVRDAGSSAEVDRTAQGLRIVVRTEAAGGVTADDVELAARVDRAIGVAGSD